MKKYLIKMVLEMTFDLTIVSLKRLAKRSDSKIDNKVVRLLGENRDEIIADIRSSL